MNDVSCKTNSRALRTKIKHRMFPWRTYKVRSCESLTDRKEGGGGHPQVIWRGRKLREPRRPNCQVETGHRRTAPWPPETAVHYPVWTPCSGKCLPGPWGQLFSTTVQYPLIMCYPSDYIWNVFIWFIKCFRYTKDYARDITGIVSFNPPNSIIRSTLLSPAEQT